MPLCLKHKGIYHEELNLYAEGIKRIFSERIKFYAEGIKFYTESIKRIFSERTNLYSEQKQGLAANETAKPCFLLKLFMS
jgi:hypothetical protein